MLARLRAGEWPRFEDGLVALVVCSPLSKAATNAALVLCLILFLRDWRRGLVRPRATSLDAALGAWVFTSLLAGVTSIDPLESFRDLRSIGHWSVFYLLAWGIAGGASRRRLENAWLAAGAACALHAMVQAAFGIDLLRRPFSVPRGFFGGHLELGHYMVVLFALALARLTYARGGHERGWLFAVLAAFGAAIVLSGGRGPWLAFVAVGVAWALLRPGRLAVAGIVFVVLLQVLFLARHPEGVASFYGSYVTFARGETTLPEISDERLGSNLWRLWMWREGLRRFALRPLTGTGVETTGELSQDFQTPFADLAVAHLHSNYFEVLMTRGFFGLAALLWLLLTAARSMRAAMAAAGDGESVPAIFTAFAAVIVHVVHGLTQFTFGATTIQIGFYVALGLGFGAAMTRNSASESVLDVRAAAYGVMTVAVAFLVLPWLAAHPWMPASIATLAAIDLAVRRAIGRSSALDDALLFAFVFVAAAAIVLLGLVTGHLVEARTVVVAATIPFAIGWLGDRARETVNG